MCRCAFARVPLHICTHVHTYMYIYMCISIYIGIHAYLRIYYAFGVVTVCPEPKLESKYECTLSIAHTHTGLSFLLYARYAQYCKGELVGLCFSMYAPLFGKDTHLARCYQAQCEREAWRASACSLCSTAPSFL